MILYHGSNIEIKQIDLSQCRPYKDFGQGFYLTTIKSQALSMATRVSKIYGHNPCITTFEFDHEALDSEFLSVRKFEAPSRD